MINEVMEDAKRRMAESIEHYKRQFSTIRTGRASAALLDNIRVDYYGTMSSIKQVAKIAVPEPALIVIQPWDATIVPNIERAILKSDLGLQPNSDGKIIRLSVPPLTEERRQQLVKLVKKMTEEGRISIRNIRRDANETIKEFLKEKEISEDQAHKGYDQTQEITDDYIKKLDKVGSDKEEEIMDV
jgi:ribosome recycling factor